MDKVGEIMIQFIQKLNIKYGGHPYDWIRHCILCWAVTCIFGVTCGVTTAIVIELTQIESGIWQRWDHLIDLAFDFVGIGIAVNYLGV